MSQQPDTLIERLLVTTRTPTNGLASPSPRNSRGVPFSPSARNRGSQSPLSSLIKIVVSRPDHNTVVVHVAGDLDAATAPELSLAVEPHLSATVETVVLDLSNVKFLGTAGLSVLTHAALGAERNRFALRLVTGPRCVERALHVSGLAPGFLSYPDLETALALAG